ncbi:hypothetical protein D3C71_1890270 [compost metagenome]
MIWLGPLPFRTAVPGVNFEENCVICDMSISIACATPLLLSLIVIDLSDPLVSLLVAGSKVSVTLSLTSVAGAVAV